MFFIPLVSTGVFSFFHEQLLTTPSFWLLAAFPPSFLALPSRPFSQTWFRESLPLPCKSAVPSNTLSMEAPGLSPMAGLHKANGSLTLPPCKSSKIVFLIST
jgi:hypothetical protein